MAGAAEGEGMERGAVGLARILAVAMAIGALVIVVRPDYRAALACLWRGRPAESPIWQSNSRYYPGIDQPAEGAHGD